MVLVSGKELLTVAQNNHFAIPAYNCGSGQLLNATVKACEETKTPFIIAIHPDELSFLTDSFVAQCIDEAHKAKVPVAIHLDHGASYEQVIHAIQLGFTSVMIDQSLAPYEKNVEMTKKVVEAAHAVGVSVEAELGTIGNTGNNVEGGLEEGIYTEPDVARDFVEQTGCDSLAIGIGTSHGLYPKDIKPKLRIDILDEIVSKVSVPLVLHGGSGNPDAEISSAVEHGISKINISSDIKIVFAEKLRELLNDGNLEKREPNVIFPEPMIETEKVVRAKNELFNAVDKAKYYFQ
ncbi:ketose-bisphosphate aldolase [Streptococcus thoraltensis]|uniref:ketose-bisphosphate aldolase n=1 Tax=Streptococcus thoraltensis TaxID=55085 RepID=UPI00035D54F7|nr:ketose-bisphosphate aldolase [Streptococcus thoraltensis]MDY4761662.1 ketose-bisphosphate aldolase [Streptococcus thoraltensis]